jgi:signal transduction histidine kinase/ligand-binding sensor domain-containing protein
MKNKIQIYACIILYIICMKFTIPAFSQHVALKKAMFKGESPPDFITGITQDVNGIMWFSTYQGLYKYDSNSFESFKTNQLDPNSITSNTLETIFADTTGMIWIGSLGNGLNRFDPSTGVFTQYQHNPNDESSLSNDTVTAILRDNNGKLWIGTYGGLDCYDEKTNSFIHHRHDPDCPNSLSSNQVFVIYEDSKNTLWVGAGSPYPVDGGGPDEGGLNRMDQDNNTFTRFMHDPKNTKSLISNKISTIFEDNEGILWVGTAKNGLHKMNDDGGTFERLVYNPEEPDKFSAPEITEQTPVYEHITFITQDINNNFWFGTQASGLYFYNPDSGKVVKYSRSESSNSGFDDRGAWTTFKSKDGIFWIGGTNGGIYYTNPLHKNIPHYNFEDKPAEAFFEESDGTFWIGSDQEVYRYVGNEKSPQKYVLETGAVETNAIYITGINEDKKNNIWVGSPGGLSLWDNKNETFTHYTHDPENNRSLSDKAVQLIYEDKKENLWLGTSNGLNLFDRETGLVTRYYPSGSSDNNRNLITSVTEDHTGKLWVGVWGGRGVNLFNPEKAEFNTYLKGSSITCVYEDTDNILWAAGMDGLYRFDRNDDIFINTRHLHHMLDVASVFSMVEDDGKNLWLSTSNGIVKINSQRDEISVYDENYGVDGSTFVFLASYKGRDGKIYFGNANGYYAFYPDELINNFNAPDIVFTGFNLRNRLVEEGEEGLLQGHLSNLNKIYLKHDQNVFSFDLMQIDYAHPEKNKMFCYLENYDDDWRQIISNQRTHYFNVPPGEYIFRVKAVNGYGVWAEKQIAITIMPPWWKQWWAYVMYGLIFTAGVFAFDRLMRRRIIQRERQKAQQKELEQAKEIEKAYTELKSTQSQLIHSEKMASLGELTAGIAHEIQNPLNFVNNFSEVNSDLIDELDEEAIKGNLEEVRTIAKDIKENEQKINHHGKRADAIVKGMLQHSRTSNGQKEPTDINTLADEYLRLSYHGMRAKDKSFNAEYKTDFDPNLPIIKVIPQDIGRVILNLINNAFYAVQAETQHAVSLHHPSQKQLEYKPMVIVSTKNTETHVEIRVKDNGPGIPSNIKDKIFQPFFTTKPTGHGTGLGLSLSYDIVKAHGGKIKVDTKENEGSKFTIILPA